MIWYHWPPRPGEPSPEKGGEYLVCYGHEDPFLNCALVFCARIAGPPDLTRVDPDDGSARILTHWAEVTRPEDL